jgi:predicted transcriptional regulator
MEYNRIYKPEKFDNYTIVPVYIFRHKGISMAASGLYSWMFSHRSDQAITTEYISGHFKESKETIRKRITELIDTGFLIREKVLDNGKFKGINYYLNDKPHKEKPDTIKPDKEKPSMDFSSQSNINNIYNNINKSIINAYPHFKELFATKYQPKNKTQELSWLECIDKCVRIDGYDLKELYLVVKYMRDDDFWNKRFMTLLKLRNQDKNGIKYVDRFFDDYKNFNKPKCYWKIKNIVKYVIYKDPDGSERLGAVTKTTKLNEFNLSQRLNKLEIEELKNHIR